MKIALVIILIVIIAITLYTPSRPRQVRDLVTKAQGNTIRQLCARHDTKTVALFKSNLGSVEYFQIPIHPPSDGFIFLYNMEGEEVARVGGLAPKVEDGNKFSEIISKLQAPIEANCDELYVSVLLQSAAVQLDDIKNHLTIRIINKDKAIYQPTSTSTISEKQFAEAKKLLSSGSHVYIVFSSPEYPGAAVTLFKLDKSQESSIFQNFSNPDTPSTEHVKVETVSYGYKAKGDGKEGILTFFVNIPDDSKKGLTLTPIRIGLITKEQWDELVQLFEVVKDKSGEAPFYWNVDDGLDY